MTADDAALHSTIMGYSAASALMACADGWGESDRVPTSVDANAVLESLRVTARDLPLGHHTDVVDNAAALLRDLRVDFTIGTQRAANVIASSHAQCIREFVEDLSHTAGTARLPASATIVRIINQSTP